MVWGVYRTMRIPLELPPLTLSSTTKHGSRLNVAEIELKALNTQCLDVGNATIQMLRREVLAWETGRNRATIGVDWQFTTADARIKLKHPYPHLRV